jgi:hypothetical protein
VPVGPHAGSGAGRLQNRPDGALYLAQQMRDQMRDRPAFRLVPHQLTRFPEESHRPGTDLAESRTAIPSCRGDSNLPPSADSSMLSDVMLYIPAGAKANERPSLS